MIENNKVSIIMPIYNGEKYINESIKRILNQSYHNIELILVNDGSKDNSLNICKNWKSKDSRVKIVNKENGGICSARNTGLEQVTGKYISFIDQDDKIKSNYCEELVKAFTNDDIDMVIAGKVMNLIDSNNKVVRKDVFRYENNLLTSEKQIIDGILNKNRDMSFLHLWNCLYKSEIIKKYNIVFDSAFKYGQEDSMFNIEYASKCKKINKIEEIVYCYDRRISVSTSTKYNSKFIEDFCYFISKMSNLLKIENKNNEMKESLYIYSLRFGLNSYYQYGLSSTSIEEKQQILKTIHTVAKETAGVDYVKINNEKLSILYIIYLKLINKLFELNNYKMAVKIIDLVKRK